MKKIFLVLALAMFGASCVQNFNEVSVAADSSVQGGLTQEQRAKKIVIDMLHRVDPQTRGYVRQIASVDFISYEQLMGSRTRTESDSTDTDGLKFNPNPIRNDGFHLINFADSTGYAIVGQIRDDLEMFDPDADDDSGAVGLLAMTDSGSITTEEILSYGDEWMNGGNTGGGNNGNSGGYNGTEDGELLIGGCNPEQYLIYLAVNYINRCYQQDGTYIERTPSNATGFFQRGPLLQTVWTQGNPFNKYFPEFAGATPQANEKVELQVAGCTTIAVAQIITYLKDISLEEHFEITNSTWNDLEDATFSKYDDPDKLNVHSDNVAKMIKQIADDIGVIYQTEVNQTSGTVKKVKTCLNNYGYSVVKKGEKRLSARVEDIVSYLNRNKPVFMSGHGNGSGHAWVLDGYMQNTESNSGDTDSYYLHCNFGWRGNSNGWYFMGLFNSEDNDDTMLDDENREDKRFCYDDEFAFIMID